MVEEPPRRDRLSVLLAQLRGVPVLDPEEAIALTPLLPYGRECSAAATDDDLALASAALSLEAELRERGYAALESLCALVAGMHGDLVDRVGAVDGRDFVYAASALVELGWIDS
jgi:hypothetical protein